MSAVKKVQKSMRKVQKKKKSKIGASSLTSSVADSVEPAVPSELEPLRNVPLNRTLIAGSHDAGTYGIRSSSPWNPHRRDLSGIVKLFKGVGARYSVTQNMNLFEQAEHGVRYFDLRAAVATDGRIRFTHGLLGDDFVEGVAPLAAWARANPFEVLILDVRFFYGTNETNCLAVQAALLEHFEPLLAPDDAFSPRSTLGDFWTARKNVIIVWHPPARRAPLFWHGARMDSHWLNVQTADELVRKTREHLAAPRADDYDRFHVIQYVMTPDTSYVLRNLFSRVQQMADAANPLLHALLDDATVAAQINIVMFDAIEKHDLVPKIRQRSLERGEKRH